MARLRRRGGGRAAQGDDHFLCAVIVPADRKDRLERALGAASDAELGAPVFASCYVPLEDFEEADAAAHQGRALGAMLHREVTERG